MPRAVKHPFSDRLSEMRSVRPWLAAALIAIAACGSSSKKTATDAGDAGHAGASGAGGAGVGLDAAAGADFGAPARRSTRRRMSSATRPLTPKRSTAASRRRRPRPARHIDALAVSTGRLHTCAILDNHRIKCWGRSPYGQLGLGDNHDLGASPSHMGDNLPFVDLGTDRTAVAVSGGRYHTCAILDDGSVKCWGFAAETGLPPRQDLGNWGDLPNEMGDNLPALVFGAGGHKAKLIASGLLSSCAILDDQSVWCWGATTPTLVPLGAHAAAVQLAPWGNGARALFADHSVSQALPDDRLQAFHPTNAVYLAGSETGGCAVLGDGTAICDLAAVESFSPAGTPAAGLLALGLNGFGEGSCGLFAGGAARCWGVCAEGPSGSNIWCGPEQADQSKPAMLGQAAVALTTDGSPHMCALLVDGGVKCWTLDAGCTTCDVPAQEAQNPNLGSSVEVVTTNNVRRYGAWHEIDLGKHP